MSSQFMNPSIGSNGGGAVLKKVVLYTHSSRWYGDTVTKTFNLTSYNGWKSFTNDNLVIESVSIAAKEMYTEFKFYTSYNASTGIASYTAKRVVTDANGGYHKVTFVVRFVLYYIDSK